MVKNPRYLIIVIIALFVALGMDVYRSTLGLKTLSVRSFAENGDVVEKEILDTSVMYKTLGYLSTFFYTIALSVFIALEVTDRINKREIDTRQKELKEFQENINENIFGAIFQNFMPEELFKAIKHDIIESKKIRKNAEWHYRFSELDGKIILNQTIKYTVQNVSQGIISNPISLDIQKEDNSTVKLISAKCSIREQEVAFASVDKSNLLNCEHKEEKHFEKFNFTCPLNPKDEMDFMAVLEHEYISDKVEDQFFTKDPIIDAKLNVIFPDNREFFLYSIMSSEFKLRVNEKGDKRYEMKGAVLPMQGFIFRLT
ncbi:hypothetical protein [Cyclobacterium plantarum]|uniref:Uncharacterized protein n=1 Tax=Cyclobacterium plantarum TaxID=2716263 RepID=A0ABX0H600_9BACT|nr:hypothetical protein [Cyclobacterium plantarum]NHE55788.1 hypothetical protein [Cyclobacterium plantarum]